MIYVLIVLWLPAYTTSGKAMFTQEFNGAQACETARAQVVRMDNQVRAVCTPKGPTT